MSDSSLHKHFADLPGPRVAGKCQHQLVEIIVISRGGSANLAGRCP